MLGPSFGILYIHTHTHTIIQEYYLSSLPISICVPVQGRIRTHFTPNGWEASYEGESQSCETVLPFSLVFVFSGNSLLLLLKCMVMHKLFF